MITDKKETRYITIQRVTLPIWLYGNPKNPPLFVIHGYPHAFSEWVGDLPIRILIKTHYVIAVDLPGFGKNQNLKMSYIQFIEETRKSLSYNRITIFGGSFGGLLALTYANCYLSRVDKLIVAGTPYFPLFILLILSPLSVLRFHFLLGAPKAFLFLNKTNLAKIAVPVLILYSKKDTVAKPKMGKKLQTLLPQASFVVIDNRKHTWLLHKVEENEFGKAIEQFLL